MGWALLGPIFLDSTAPMAHGAEGWVRTSTVAEACSASCAAAASLDSVASISCAANAGKLKSAAVRWSQGRRRLLDCTTNTQEGAHMADGVDTAGF